jgi:DNA-binding MarR family transcriptional regulator
MAKAKALRTAEADAQSDVEPLMAPADLVCTHTSLRRAARRLGQLYDEAIAPTGLTSSQALLLAQIDALSAFYGEAGPTLGVLADRLAIRISALTHALRPLVRDGLIEVRQDEQDRRAKRSVMTSLGKARHKQMLGLWIDANSRVEAALGAASTEKLRSLADRIASEEFLDAYTADGSHAGPKSAAIRG